MTQKDKRIVGAKQSYLRQDVSYRESQRAFSFVAIWALRLQSVAAPPYQAITRPPIPILHWRVPGGNSSRRTEWSSAVAWKEENRQIRRPDSISSKVTFHQCLNTGRLLSGLIFSSASLSRTPGSNSLDQSRNMTHLVIRLILGFCRSFIVMASMRSGSQRHTCLNL